MSMNDRLRELVQPIVDDLGLELYDLDYAGATLAVTIDRPPAPAEPLEPAEPAGLDEAARSHSQPSGVTLEDITAVTRAVSRTLDEHDPIPGRFSLEVSSPGLERVLRTPTHFERAVGLTVTIRLTPAAEGNRRLKGRLVRADADSFDLLVDRAGPEGADPDVRTVRYLDIDRARTVFAWGPQPRPGKDPAPKKGPRTTPSGQTLARGDKSAKSAKSAKKTTAEKKVTAS
jgi:ribosome maturation factor RimP